MDFFKNLISSALGTFIAIGLFFVFMFVFFAGSIALLEQEDFEVEIDEKTVLVLDTSKPIFDREPQDFSFFDALEIESAGFGLNTILPALEMASSDDKIIGISIKNMSAAGGTSNLIALRNGLKKFKESGKFIKAYSDGYTQADYFLASIADSIFVHPEGLVDFRGLSAEVMYYKSAQEKSGVTMEVIRQGKYKSAVEPYLFDKMSNENRIQIKTILSDVWSEMVDDIADSRGIDVKKLNVLADNLAGKNANSALKHSLVDGIVTQRNYDEKIKEIDEDVEFISLASYLNVPNSKKIKSSNRIAVVYAEGPIIYGEGSTEVIGSGKLVRTLKSIGKKDNIKAVVIRVNSPGGSAFASELIWEEIEELKKNKTVVVSMGNVAASGGYYISAGADEIVAMPTTITGSIGVLGTLPNFNKIATRWGVNAEQVMTNKQSMGYSPFEPVSNDFRNEVKSSIKQIYDTFLKRVSNGRSMSIEEVHEIAQGRVWSGKKAKEIGLIDHLGGMDVALERASKLADIEDYKISVYPKYIEDLETIYEELFSGPFGKIKNKLPSEIVMIFDSEKSLLTKKEIIQARIPYTLKIR